MAASAHRHVIRSCGEGGFRGRSLGQGVQGSRLRWISSEGRGGEGHPGSWGSGVGGLRLERRPGARVSRVQG